MRRPGEHGWGWVYKEYPRWQFEWCGHCGERIEYKRIGTGRIERDARRRPVRDFEGKILRDYQYVEVDEKNDVAGVPHECQGLRKEKAEAAKRLKQTNARLTAFMNEVLSREL